MFCFIISLIRIPSLINSTKAGFSNNSFCVIILLGTFSLKLKYIMKGVIIIPAPKPIMVKDLRTQQTRAFKSQTEADKFYGKKQGYFKDIKCKLGGKNRHYEIIEVV